MVVGKMKASKKLKRFPIWKLNFIVWRIMSVAIITMGVLDFLTGYFPFIQHLNLIAVMMQIGAAEVLNSQAQRYFKRASTEMDSVKENTYLCMVWISVGTIWANLFLNGLYVFNFIVAALYFYAASQLGGKTES